MLGFIGLGTMGAPICRNLAAKSGQEVRAFDGDLEILAQMDEPGVAPAESVRDVAEHADIVFLSLPGGQEVTAVCLGAGSLLTHLKLARLRLDAGRALGDRARLEAAARGLEELPPKSRKGVYVRLHLASIRRALGDEAAAEELFAGLVKDAARDPSGAFEA